MKFSQTHRTAIWKRLLLLILCAFVSVSSSLALTSCSLGNDPASQTASLDRITFQEYTDLLFRNEIVQDTISLHYTVSNPASYDISDYNICLPDYSPEAEDALALRLENIRCGLASYDYDKLTIQQQLTYDLLQEYAGSEDNDALSLYPEILRPSTGFCAQLPVLLAEYHFYRQQDVIDYLELLRLIPDCFAGICAYEKAKADAGLFMSDTQADTVLASIAALTDTTEEHYLITTFRNKLENLPDLSQGEKDAFCQENEDAFLRSVLPAYQQLADCIAALKGSGTNDAGLCYYPNGSEYYQELVYASTGSSRSIDELLKLTEQQRLEDITAIMELSSDGTDLTVNADDFPLSGASPEEMLTRLTAAITDQFSPPVSTVFSVNYVDECMQEAMAPAFYLTAPMDDLSHNMIYINPASAYDDLDLFTTLAHEGFPGHLYQTTQTAAAGISPVRNLLNYPGYVEGWATYVEMLSYGYTGLPEQQAELLMHNKSAILSLYATADLSIHAKGWTKSDLYNFFRGFGLGDEETIREIYDYIVSEPAHYLKYYIGYVEFLELKKYAKETWDDAYSDRAFHDAILSIGPAPFDIIKKYLPDYFNKA
ncbi:MAG: DUF885 domain-containing protein [Lachnospiraceae bacterium]|nr:DUF885 domain-containing protein [Lachnospiraceae bacterium]